MKTHIHYDSLGFTSMQPADVCSSQQPNPASCAASPGNTHSPVNRVASSAPIRTPGWQNSQAGRSRGHSQTVHPVHNSGEPSGNRSAVLADDGDDDMDTECVPVNSPDAAGISLRAGHSQGFAADACCMPSGILPTGILPTGIQPAGIQPSGVQPPGIQLSGIDAPQLPAGIPSRSLRSDTVLAVPITDSATASSVNRKRRTEKLQHNRSVRPNKHCNQALRSQPPVVDATASKANRQKRMRKMAVHRSRVATMSSARAAVARSHVLPSQTGTSSGVLTMPPCTAQCPQISTVIPLRQTEASTQQVTPSASGSPSASVSGRYDQANLSAMPVAVAAVPPVPVQHPENDGAAADQEHSPERKAVLSVSDVLRNSETLPATLRLSPQMKTCPHCNAVLFAQESQTVARMVSWQLLHYNLLHLRFSCRHRIESS